LHLKQRHFTRMKFRTAVIAASYETSSKRAIIPQLLHIQRGGADFSPLSLSLLSSFTVNCTEEAATSAPEVARPIEYRVRISTWRSYDAQLLLSRLLKSPRSPSRLESFRKKLSSVRSSSIFMPRDTSTISRGTTRRDRFADLPPLPLLPLSFSLSF